MRKIKTSWSVKFPHVVYGNPFSPIAVCLIYGYRYPDRGMDVTEKDLREYERHMNLCRELVGWGAAVAGLQNTEFGISFVAETLFSNPNIRWLVVVGKVGGHRIDVVYRSIKLGHYEGVRNYLDRDSFDRFRRQITIIDLIGEDPFRIREELKGIIEAAYQEEPTRVKACDKEYVLWDPGAYEGAEEEHELKADILFLGGSLVVKAEDIRHAWRGVNRAVEEYGRVIRDHRGERLVLSVPLLLIVERPLDWKGLNVASMESYFVESFMRSELMEEGYTYGNRISAWFGVNQLEKAVEKLKRGRLTQAHISLYDPRRDSLEDEIPCLTEIHIKVSGREVLLRATMRSWDVARALPYNLYALSRILKEVSGKLGRRPGHLVVLADEPHVYLSHERSKTAI
ncbi:MAG: hypothetical protein J7L11_01450 [Thermoprotei archaeon]|nr:hypothetical protein [Thermoprotei archaeon]